MAVDKKQKTNFELDTLNPSAAGQAFNSKL
jgi:hypothetical protein